MNPLISVIIPVYNSEAYLERCVTSVLEQDYRPIEIVLINDGSTDTSASLCERLRTDYPSVVRVIHQANTGASIARKNGIEAAKGEYIVFVDSDDFVSSFYVSSLYNAIRSTKSTMSVCSVKCLRAGEDVQYEQPNGPVVLSQKELFKKFYNYEFWGFYGGCYPRELFSESIIYPDATINEDYYVKTQIFSHQESVAYVSTPLYYYEKHTGSLSSLPLSIRALGEVDNAIASLEYIKKHCPQYSLQALAIASEAVSKWLGRLRNNPDSQYAGYRSLINSFIKSNFLRIFANPFLLWKVKIVMLRNLISKCQN
ncbi:MAG: glycosyltransferase family 2 protein [Muribaculaceae bacterium]|nr:glycosyltransferase family 2 protein [Muribaculaceae bacterium]